MKRAVLAALLLVLVATPAAADRAELTQKSERLFDATGVRRLRVENPRGFAEVKRSGDNQVHLWALKRIRAPHAQQERLARETTVETTRNGDQFVVQVHYPQGSAMRISFFELFAGFETPRVDVQLSIEVPEGVAVEMRSASGNLRTANMAGGQQLATTSGDIRIEGATGPVSASATSGDIEASGLVRGRLRSVSGDVSVKGVLHTLEVATTSGQITIQGAADSLHLDSVSGDVEVEGSPRFLSIGTTSGDVAAREVAGALTVSTSSGDLDLQAAAGLVRADLTSVSGDVTMAVPPRYDATVDMQTSSGALDVSLPFEVRTVTRRLLRGTLGRGTARLSLKSSSGDLHVTSAGSGS